MGLGLFSTLQFAVCLLLIALLCPQEVSARKPKAKQDTYDLPRTQILTRGENNLLSNDQRRPERVESIRVAGQTHAIVAGGSYQYRRPQGAVLTVFSNGNIEFDPRTDSEYSQHSNPANNKRKTFEFLYRAVNGDGRSNLAKVRIKIRGVPLSPPTARDDGPYSIFANETLNRPSGLGLLSNDTSALEVSNFFANGQSNAVPPGGEVAINLDSGAVLTIGSDGMIQLDVSGAPIYQALGPTETAEVTFSYTAANDDGESDPAAISIVVTGKQGFTPTLKPDGFSTVADNVLSVDSSLGLLQNDVNPNEGSALVVSELRIGGVLFDLNTLHELATGARLRVNDDGSFVFDPTGAEIYTSMTRDEAGLTQNFSYNAANSDGESEANAIVTISVTPINIDTVTAAIDDSVTLPEDSGRTLINVLANDSGDVPLRLVSVGGAGRTGTVVQGAGTVSVANVFELGDDGNAYFTAWDNFNGIDSFTYRVADSDGQIAEGSVTITVESENDVPNIFLGLRDEMDQGTTKKWNGRYASESKPLGLAARVFDTDNTIYDGLGCNPEAEECLSMQALKFSLSDPVDDKGNVVGDLLAEDACGNGNFEYTPPPEFTGAVSFAFNACDGGSCSGLATECVSGNFTIAVLEVEREASSDFKKPGDHDDQLTQQPLEIGLSALPNVLVITDDSGSMAFEILTEEAESEGVFRYDRRNHQYFWPDNSSWLLNQRWARKLTQREETRGGQGLWRLQNSDYNKIYYNPMIRYEPWEGLNEDGESYQNSEFNGALVNPWKNSGRRDLSRNNLARYYVWVDKKVANPNAGVAGQPDFVRDPACPGNVVGVLDGPSPLGGSACREGWLVRIGAESGASEWVVPTGGDATLIDYSTNGFSDGSDFFPKFEARVDCVGLDFCTLEEEKQNFANYYSYARSREYAAKLALSTVFSEAENIRLGFTGLQSTAEKLPISPFNRSPLIGHKRDFFDAMYDVNSAGNTPLRRALRNAGQYFRCERENNIMNAGDGLPGAHGCPVVAAPEGTCQSNTTILITDGYWTGDSPGLRGDPDGNDDSAFDGGAFKGSGNESNTLADVAMKYYEEDLHPTLVDEVPVKALDVARANAEVVFPNNRMHQHMKTYVISFGQEPGVEEPIDISMPVNWGDPIPSSNKQQRVDDTQHAAFNGRGRLFSSSNPSQLAKDINDVLDEIQEGEGAASAVSFSSDELEEDSILYKGSYNIAQSTGALVAQRLRADGTILDQPLWDAGSELSKVDPVARPVFTFNPLTNSGVPFFVDNLTCDQKDALLELSVAGCNFSGKAAELSEKVAYFRGDQSRELDPENGKPDGLYRPRASLLGDIVGSSPVYVDVPNRRGRNALPYPQGEKRYFNFKTSEIHSKRPNILYTGANDGILHGFDGDTGQERLAYIPSQVLDGRFNNRLKMLSALNYQHRYFVDLSPAVEDVFIGPPSSEEELSAGSSKPRDWHTLLLGGYGLGGKGFFALNITDPTDFESGASGDDLVFWEFTEKDDVYPVDSNGLAYVDDDRDLFFDFEIPPKPIKDLGYTTDRPLLAMSNIVGSDGEREWVALFGNGINSTSGIAKLFALKLDAGRDGIWCHPDSLRGDEQAYREGCDSEAKDFYKITTENGADTDGNANGLGGVRGIDIDRNGTIDYVYAGDVHGNFYRFDLCRADLEGTTQEDDSASDWYGGGLRQCKYGASISDQWRVTKIFSATSSLGSVQPALSKPIVVAHPSGVGVIVIFATGRYSNRSDITDTALQSIYGLWDRFSDSVIPKSALVKQQYSEVCESLVSGGSEVDDSRICARTLSSNPVNYSIPTDDFEGILGWYNELAVTAEGDPTTIEHPGERAIRNIQLRGGLAFVNSVLPRQGAETCSSITGGFALAFCPVTGGLQCQEEGIFDLNNDGLFDQLAGDGTNRILAAYGFGSATPSDSAFLGERRFTQTSDGTLDVVLTNTKKTIRTGRMSWRRIN